jgi:hypothetical protein
VTLLPSSLRISGRGPGFSISRLLTAGLAAGVPLNTQNLSPPNPIPACAAQSPRSGYHYNHSFANWDKE